MLNRFRSFSTSPLHITGRCPQSEWSQAGPKKVWSLFCSELSNLHKNTKLQTHAFVMMSNHYHWLCLYENYEQDPGLFAWFQESLSFELFHLQFSKKYDLSPRFHFFEGPPKITVINHPEVYRNSYYYIYRNPVVAGLAVRAEKYPYSTLPMVLGERKMHFPCVDQMNLIYHPQNILEKIHDF